MAVVTKFNFKFDEGDRIRLKFDVADIYRRAFGGSEGVVKKCKVDKLGHHGMVWVEWDKTQWCYNGEIDMWAFEDHFDLVKKEEKMEDKNERDFMEALQRFVQDWRRAGDGDASSDDELRLSKADDKSDDDDVSIVEEADEGVEAVFADILKNAHEYATQCDAFLIVGVQQEEVEGVPMLVPDVFACYKTDDAGILLEAQLSQMAAAFHAERAETLIYQNRKQRRDGNDR